MVKHVFSGMRSSVVWGLIVWWCITQWTYGLDSSQPLMFHNIRRWDTSHGLLHNSIRAVLQTRDSYLWVATESGLARFNGDGFLPFSTITDHAQELHPVPGCFLEDRQGVLWIGTETSGVLKYRAGTFDRLGQQEGVPGGKIRSLYEDRRGRIWIGTSMGVSVWDGHAMSPLNKGQLPENLEVFGFLENQDGSMWFATYRGLYGPLAALDDPVPHVGSTFSSPIYAICSDDDGGMWLGGSTGLMHRGREGELAFYGTGQDLHDTRIYALHMDRQRVLWVGTATGLNRVVDHTVIQEKCPAGLDNISIRGFLEDREGNFWLATSEGLLCLQDASFATFSARDGLTYEEVIALYEEKPGTLWLGAMRGGLASLDHGRYVTHNDHWSLMDMTAMLRDKEGGLWVGTRKAGLFRLMGERCEQYADSHGLIDINIFALCEDAKGALWTGTAKGLHRFNGRSFEYYELPWRTNVASVRAVVTDNKNALWVGTGDGLFVVGSNRTNRYSLAEGLPAGLVYCVHIDKEGRAWLGTASGLVTRMPDGWRVWPDHVAENRHHVFWVTDDGLGQLWYSSPWGIYRVGKQALLDHFKEPSRTVESRHFGLSDGLLSMECMGGRQQVGCKTQDGRLWFSTKRGLAIVDPARLCSNSVAPTIHFESFLVNGQPQAVEDHAVLPPGSTMIEFRHDVLSFTAPEKIQVHHRLEGVDKGWVRDDRRRSALYANLKPGRYVFKVRAANNDGVWNRESASLAFVIRPYFYQTTWFLITCACVVVLGPILAHYLWLMRARRHEMELRQLVFERTRELEAQMQERLRLEEKLRMSQKMEAVGQLAAGVAHYFNNLLTIIQGYAMYLKDPSHHAEDREEAVEHIDKASNRAAQMVQQLLSFSQLHGVNLKATDLNSFLLGQEKAVQQMLDGTVQLRVGLHPRLPEVMLDANLMRQALQNVVANARDAMPQGGTLELRTGIVEVSSAEAAQWPEGRAGTFVTLEVRDTGCGMSPDVISRVFEPFFTTKDVGKGTGLGLPVVYGILRQHQGWLRIASQPEDGTTVIFLLPVPAQEQGGV